MSTWLPSSCVKRLEGTQKCIHLISIFPLPSLWSRNPICIQVTIHEWGNLMKGKSDEREIHISEVATLLFIAVLYSCNQAPSCNIILTAYNVCFGFTPRLCYHQCRLRISVLRHQYKYYGGKRIHNGASIIYLKSALWIQLCDTWVHPVSLLVKCLRSSIFVWKVTFHCVGHGEILLCYCLVSWKFTGNRVHVGALWRMPGDLTWPRERIQPIGNKDIGSLRLQTLSSRIMCLNTFSTVVRQYEWRTCSQSYEYRGWREGGGVLKCYKILILHTNLFSVGHLPILNKMTRIIIQVH